MEYTIDMSRHVQTVSDVLRKAIQESGRPLRQVAEEAGVDAAAVIRFVNGTRTLRLPSVDRLANVLSLQLVGRRPVDGSRRKKRF
jgi:hypothetical protein